MGLFDRFKKTSKESLLGYLKNSISDNSSLEHIVSDIFSYIKKTPEFNFCKDKVFSKIEIYLDET